MSTSSRARLLFGVAGLGAAAWLPHSAAIAQEAGQGEQVGAAVQEIVVTARRREESLQDVPLAISAVGGEELEQRGVQNVGNLNANIPNLSVMGGGNSGESQASFRVRGIPGVAVYIDGVNQSTTDGLLTMSVVEVDRIEVLRGPQGTLFGNAAVGGAVHYVTREPGDEFGIRFQGSIGSYSRRDFQGAIDLPLHDTFKVKFTAASQKRDGFVRSLSIDREYGDVNDELLRADFLWTPLDSVRVRYNIEQSDTDRIGPARVIWEIGPMGTFTGAGGTLQNRNPAAQAYVNAFNVHYTNANYAANYPGGRVGKYENYINWQNPGLRIEQMRHTLDLNWEINDTFAVRSISGYKDLTRAVQVDFDGADAVMLLERDNRTKQFNFSQELQLLGSHERVDWVLGAYYAQDHARDRTVTWGMPEFTCDMWSGAAARGVTSGQAASCLANRRLALGAPAGTPANQLNSFNNQGVTMATFSAMSGANNDSMTFSKPETQAIFGDVTWRITDQLSIAAGLRYSKDESQSWVVSGNSLAVRGPVLPDTDVPNWFGIASLPAPRPATEYSATTKRLTLQYQWNPDIMTYIGYADGYAPGGQSNTPPSTVQYMSRVPASESDIPLFVERDEQTIDNYELGLRADWMGGTLRTNVTAFFTDWQNVPVSQYVATRFWDTNGDGFADSAGDFDGNGANDILYFPSLWTVAISKAEVKGLEFEGTWLPTDSLRLGLNLGFLDTKYKELGQAGEGAVPAVSLDSKFAGAPEITATLNASYDINLGNGGRITPRVDYTYTDDYTLQAMNDLSRTQEAFGLLNASITYSTGENWDVRLQGTNLTNEYYFNSGFYTRAEQIHFMTLGRPREWGLTFNFRFQ